MKDKIVHFLQQILKQDDTSDIRDTCIQLFDFLMAETAFDMEAISDVKTHTGTALNAYSSAYCIRYPIRTKKTLLSIINQIEQGKTRILYVGPGPFAPYFFFPILLGYKAKFTLLEINTYAVKMIRHLVEKLGVEDCVELIEEGDATTWTSQEKFDLVQIQTSDVGLRREDTLPIYKHLKSVFPKSKFLPQEVLILSGSDIQKSPLIEYDSLSRAVKRGYLKTKMSIAPEDKPFIQNKIILDEQWVIEPWEAVNTMPWYLKAEDYIFEKA